MDASFSPSRAWGVGVSEGGPENEDRYADALPRASLPASASPPTSGPTPTLTLTHGQAPAPHAPAPAAQTQTPSNSPRSGLGARRRAPVPLELGIGRAPASASAVFGRLGGGSGGPSAEEWYTSAELRGGWDGRQGQDQGRGWQRRVVTEPTNMHAPTSPAVQTPSTAASAYSAYTRPSHAGHPASALLSPQVASATASIDRRARRTSVDQSQTGIGGGASGNITASASDRSSAASSLALPPIPDSLARAEREMDAEERERASLDSYYTRPSPARSAFGEPSLASLRITTPPRLPASGSATSATPAHFRSPSTPGPPDPRGIDRRGLIGVGELATPRWATQGGGHARRATTQMPASESYDSITGVGARLREGGEVPSLVLGSWAERAGQRQQSAGESAQVILITGGGGGGDDSRRTSFQPPKSAGWTERSARDELPALPRLPSIPYLGDFAPFKALAGDLSGEGASGGASDPSTPSSLKSASSADTSRARHRATSSSTYTSGQRYSPKVQADLQALREREASRQTQPPSSPLSQGSFKQPSSAGSREISAGETVRAVHAVQEGDRRARKRSGGSVASDDRTEVGGPTAHRDRGDDRDSRKTPPSATRRAMKQAGDSPLATTMPANAHSIIRQFSSTRDFRDLPPSPSSASINKLLKESSSMQSFVNRDGTYATPTTSSPLSPAGGVNASASRFNRGTYSALDRETEEAIRKLDGLGKAGMRKGDEDSSLARRIRKAASSSSVGQGSGSSATTPPPLPTNASPSTRKDNRRSMFAGSRDRERFSPLASVDPSDDDDKRAKRASSSSASAGTETFSLQSSSASTALTSGSSFSQAGSKLPRRTSVGSEAFLSDSEPEAPAGLPIPPVPPLPKDFQTFGKPSSLPRSNSHIYGVSQPQAASYVPVKDGSEPVKTLTPLIVGEGRMPSSASSPALSAYQEHSPMPDSASTTQLADSTEKPRRMSKKWSFSSALGLNSFASLHGKDKFNMTSPNVEGPRSAILPNGSALSPTSPSPGPDSAPVSQSFQADRGLAVVDRRLDLATARTTSSTSSASTIQRVQQHSQTLPGKSTASAPNNRRMTPSSLPFFRRTSSSSVSTSATVEGLAIKTDNKGDSSTNKMQAGSLTSRKSVLGMGIPSLLKGSSSKRNLAAASQRAEGDRSDQQGRVNEDGTMGEAKASSSWGSRKRSKTFSISGGSSAGIPVSPREIQHDPFARVEPKQNAAVQPQSTSSGTESSDKARSSLPRSATHGTLLEGRSSLATIAGSPGQNVAPPSTPAGTSATASASHGPRSTMAATPTRIPRIVSRTNMGSPGVAGTMGPPKQPYAFSSSPRPSRTGAGTVGSMQTGKAAYATPRRSNMAPPSSEFGILDGARAQPTSRATAREAALELPRVEDSPSLTSPAPSSGMSNLRKVSAPAASSKRSLPVPPAASAVSSASVAGQTSCAQSRDLPLPPANRRISLASTAVAPDQSLTSAKYSLANRATLQSGSRLAASSSQPFLSGARPASLRQSVVSRSVSPLEVGDEDELRGDEEMGSFYRRQSTKRTAKDTAADEIDHLMQFPENGAPLPEMTPHAFVQAKFDCLSMYERHEIVGFQSIFYSGNKSQKNAATREVTQNNHGYDDERGDYLVIPGDHLAYRYEIEGVLGRGSFGQVLQCRDHKTGLCVAIKIIRNKKRFHQQALVEVKILEKLIDWDPQDVHHLIKITDNFYFRDHLCIVTELLSINLYELIKANSFVGFSSTLIRRFTRQMLASLDIMRQKRVIHCDLKPENILLCHPGRSKIKVIDFGSSCFEHEKVYTYIQSRFYRSPEIILGSNYHMAIDMWSLGCILAELYTGFPIFPGEDEKEQLSCIMEVLGVPDRGLVERSSRKKLFFDANGSPRPFVNSKGKRRRPGTKTIAQVLKSDDDQFVDFIAKCLVWDPERRLKPSTAMQHPWIRAAKRARVSSSQPASTSASRLGLGLASSASGTVQASSSGRNRSLQQDYLKGRISGPSPLVARNSIASASGAAGTASNGNNGDISAFGSTGRLYKTSRGVAA